jgi:hypothetical protein|tara:strand:- start:85 stop:528 length:444 start_codon:yes stop_codon:yes gene_type:complete
MVKEGRIMANVNLKIFHNNGVFVTFISDSDNDDTVAHITSDKIGELTSNYITVDEATLPLPWQLSIVENTVSVLEGTLLVAAELKEESDASLSSMRDVRNRLLAKTDWMGNSDVVMSENQRLYRQALRDITDNYTSLEDVVWPVKPV